MTNPKIICFGEMLWDILPTGKQAGGAPMNVAVQLKNLGLNPLIISRVGDDELGEELIQVISQKGLSTELVQHGKTHLTGVVKANVSDQNEVTYKIVHPVAWDYIQPEESLTAAVQNTDVFIFGSLAARSEVTSNTLQALLKQAKFKVFDVNLRTPFYNEETVTSFLEIADMVKMNENELALIASWYDESPALETAMLALAKRFDIQTLCVTLGADGAILLKDGVFYQNKGFSVEVKDTIGSGDAFLAGLLKNLLQLKNPAESLRFACAMGSLVATYQGATPQISESQVMAMM
ncbi:MULTISPECIES: carbohydrate kinase [unclassified Arcicella]|uniref:carbohydrate kinase family protein n=1 Tax=unclassified Arcicella TaxID=2644986 RepID=UPI0028582602|nr:MULTISPECIES: carbohydrate kinase [unclassified Arcicella]MDR6562348.1 fructokinase [Arcicella sp. BE51]MDR6812242.1 fructokinase [Arcicella sp. BE140]MDR6823573.1 fructokinase [Arcicella sp. BE139]